MKVFFRRKITVVRRGALVDAEENESRSERSHFRRNQTIGGYRQEVVEESSRRHVHNLTLKRRKVGGVFLIASLVVVILLVLLTQFTAQVQVTGSSSQVTTSFAPHEQEYREAIHEYYGTHPAERLRFLLNTRDLSTYLSSLHPEVKSVALTEVAGLVESRFTMTFREPVASWQIRGKQFYVDSEGVVFERNYYGVPAVSIVDESGIDPEQGTAVASGRLLGFVGKIVALSKGRGYVATQAVLPVDTTRRLDVKFEGVTPVVRFAIDGGAGEQVSDMVQSLQYLSEKNIPAEYVDVRVSGRTVYK